MKKILLFMLVFTMTLGSIGVGATDSPTGDVNKSVTYWYNGIGFDFDIGDKWVNNSYKNDFYFSAVENNNKYLTINWIEPTQEIKDEKDRKVKSKMFLDILCNNVSEDEIRKNLAEINNLSEENIKISKYHIEANPNYDENKMDLYYDLTYTAAAGDKNPTDVYSKYYCQYKNDHLYYLEFSSNQPITDDDEATIEGIIKSIHFSPYIDVRDVDVENISDPKEAELGRGIPDKHWASDVIGKWSEAGILNGYGDGRFEPDDQLKYNQFSKIISYLDGSNTVNDNKELKDKITIPEEKAIVDNWSLITTIPVLANGILDPATVISWDESADYINNPISDELKAYIKSWGVDVDSLGGIIIETAKANGIPTDSIDPDNPITIGILDAILSAGEQPIEREVAFAMLSRMLDLDEEELSPEFSNEFSDLDNINDNYKKLIYTMINHKYISGKPGSDNMLSIDSNGKLTRAEAMKIVDNTIAYWVDDLSELLNTSGEYILNMANKPFDENGPKPKFILIKNGVSNSKKADVNIDIDNTKYKVICKDKNVITVYDRGNIEIDVSAYSDNAVVMFDYSYDGAVLDLVHMENKYTYNSALTSNAPIAYKTTNTTTTADDISKNIGNVKVNNETCDVSCVISGGTIKLTLSPKAEAQPETQPNPQP